jgi:hypothetical protein
MAAPQQQFNGITGSVQHNQEIPDFKTKYNSNAEAFAQLEAKEPNGRYTGMSPTGEKKAGGRPPKPPEERRQQLNTGLPPKHLIYWNRKKIERGKVLVKLWTQWLLFTYPTPMRCFLINPMKMNNHQ